MADTTMQMHSKMLLMFINFYSMNQGTIMIHVVSGSEKIIENLCVCGFESGYGEVKREKYYFEKLKSLI